jgi:hypothetical protein
MSSPDRIEEFKQELGDLKIGMPSAERERFLLIASIVLLIVGVVLIAGGWWGASGEDTVVLQFPYLISGGVGGLACVITGSVLFARYSMTKYLRYWLIRLIYEQQAQADRIEQAVNGGAATPAESSDASV